MKIFYLIKSGLYSKRWLVLGAVGSFFIASELYLLLYEKLGVDSFKVWHLVIFFLGILLVFISIIMQIKIIITFIGMANILKSNRKSINKQVVEKYLLNSSYKVVVIGGGTGLSVILRGIKKVTSNITAVVTVTDDGGGSGKLREDLGMLPPGDIRNCILSLANTEPVMEEVLQYRFTEGSLKGQSFGNLLIAAMNGISDTFEEAVTKVNDIVAVTGKVLPVTLDNVTLCAEFKNKKIVKGETNIANKSIEMQEDISRVFIEPKDAKPLQDVIDALLEADVIVFGPGSLYTSIIPNLLINGVSEAIIKSKAVKVYINNIMTQPGETDGYSVSDHIDAINKHINEKIINYVIVNNEEIPQNILEKYIEDGSKPIIVTKKDRKKLKKEQIEILESPLIDIKHNYIRHDALKIAKTISEIVLKEKYENKTKKKLNYYLINEILNKST